jgi:hypothetical protein
MLVGNGVLDMDSRLLGIEEFNSPKLQEALEKATPKDIEDGELKMHLTGGGKVLIPSNESSVLPAWRKTYIHAIATGRGSPSVDALREFAPNMGAYVNEASCSRDKSTDSESY